MNVSERLDYALGSSVVIHTGPNFFEPKLSQLILCIFLALQFDKGFILDFFNPASGMYWTAEVPLWRVFKRQLQLVCSAHVDLQRHLQDFRFYKICS